MALHGWIQLVVFMGSLFLLTKPVGRYLGRVLEPDGKTFLDPVFKPVERLIYRLLGVDPFREMAGKRYLSSLLYFSLAGFVFTFAILRLQHLLPLNPGHLGPVRPDLAFNTAVSFATNTNWQSYAGESTLSPFSQMVGLVFQNFVSAAVGLAVAAGLIRSIARSAAKTIGNFWTDLVRVNLYLLLPLSFVFSVFLMSQGVVQNFIAASEVKTLETADRPSAKTLGTQILAQGPAASQTAIKMLGTNGGGFFNANAAHPYENPTPASNFVQLLAIFLLPCGLIYFFGEKVKNRKHGRAVWAAMAVLFLATLLVGWRAESAGNPRLKELGADASSGNMEGKEVRFGVFDSTLFSAVTTSASCGAVNSMHDSFTPLGGLIPLLNIQLGEVAFGGVGAGLYGMIVFIILAVFLTGLMVGRTPEYLGKKIDSFDVKAAVFAILVPILCILGFTAWAVVSRSGLAGPANGGPHGFSEILYAFSSASGNNGSAFAGLSSNTPWYNLTLGGAMLAGRFLVIAAILALAGHLAGQKRLPPNEANFPVHGPLFVVILIGTVLIVGALTFLPALALGPIVEHFLLNGSGVVF
jgi:K+-transporting ATPase ATPase A chain